MKSGQHKVGKLSIFRIGVKVDFPEPSDVEYAAYFSVLLRHTQQTVDTSSWKPMLTLAKGVIWESIWRESCNGNIKHRGLPLLVTAPYRRSTLMFNTRLLNYLHSSDYSSRISSEVYGRLPADSSVSFPVSHSDIYRSAYETAKRDYELNRLFNPHYYNDGGGI